MATLPDALFWDKNYIELHWYFFPTRIKVKINKKSNPNRLKIALIKIGIIKSEYESV